MSKAVVAAVPAASLSRSAVAVVPAASIGKAAVAPTTPGSVAAAAVAVTPDTAATTTAAASAFFAAVASAAAAGKAVVDAADAVAAVGGLSKGTATREGAAGKSVACTREADTERARLGEAEGPDKPLSGLRAGESPLQRVNGSCEASTAAAVRAASLPKAACSAKDSRGALGRNPLSQGEVLNGRGVEGASDTVGPEAALSPICSCAECRSAFASSQLFSPAINHPCAAQEGRELSVSLSQSLRHLSAGMTAF